MDTSSLLKLYHNEPGTDTLIAELSCGVENIYLSELARIERAQALLMKYGLAGLRTLDAIQLASA
ncbi:hypothetical protein BGP_6551 [Beggiatoa sp. PS]|nr:hypothetical protein BGP_6551 [Beggiatoa sp. PS]